MTESKNAQISEQETTFSRVESLPSAETNEARPEVGIESVEKSVSTERDLDTIEEIRENLAAINAGIQVNDSREEREGVEKREKVFLSLFRKPSAETYSKVVINSVAFGGVALIGSFLSVPGMREAALLSAIPIIATSVTAHREKEHYGNHLSVNRVALARNIDSLDGERMISKDSSLAAELHLVGNLSRMRELSKKGRNGKLEILHESLQDLKLFIEDLGNPKYEDVEWITAYSDIVSRLIKLGFTEASYDKRPSIQRVIVNYLVQNIYINLLSGRKNAPSMSERKLAVISKDELVSDEMKENVDKELEKIKKILGK